MGSSCIIKVESVDRKNLSKALKAVCESISALKDRNKERELVLQELIKINSILDSRKFGHQIFIGQFPKILILLYLCIKKVISDQLVLKTVYTCLAILLGAQTNEQIENYHRIYEAFQNAVGGQIYFSYNNAINVSRQYRTIIENEISDYKKTFEQSDFYKEHQLNIKLIEEFELSIYQTINNILYENNHSENLDFLYLIHDYCCKLPEVLVGDILGFYKIFGDEYTSKNHLELISKHGDLMKNPILQDFVVQISAIKNSNKKISFFNFMDKKIDDKFFELMNIIVNLLLFMDKENQWGNIEINSVLLAIYFYSKYMSYNKIKITIMNLLGQCKDEKEFEQVFFRDKNDFLFCRTYEFIHYFLKTKISNKEREKLSFIENDMWYADSIVENMGRDLSSIRKLRPAIDIKNPRSIMNFFDEKNSFSETFDFLLSKFILNLTEIPEEFKVVLNFDNSGQDRSGDGDNNNVYIRIISSFLVFASAFSLNTKDSKIKNIVNYLLPLVLHILTAESKLIGAPADEVIDAIKTAINLGILKDKNGKVISQNELLERIELIKRSSKDFSSIDISFSANDEKLIVSKDLNGSNSRNYSIPSTWEPYFKSSLSGKQLTEIEKKTERSNALAIYLFYKLIKNTWLSDNQQKYLAVHFGNLPQVEEYLAFTKFPINSDHEDPLEYFFHICSAYGFLNQAFDLEATKDCIKRLCKKENSEFPEKLINTILKLEDFCPQKNQQEQLKIKLIA